MLSSGKKSRNINNVYGDIEIESQKYFLKTQVNQKLMTYEKNSFSQGQLSNLKQKTYEGIKVYGQNDSDQNQSYNLSQQSQKGDSLSVYAD